MNNIVFSLITGASSGIGKAIAYECAGRGMNLLLVALPDSGLEQVASDIRQKHNVEIHTLELDLTRLEGPKSVLDWCEGNKFGVNMLVNNAGMAGTAIFEASALEYSDSRILLNIRALVLLTRLFIPLLKEQSRSYVLNIGSMSAYFAIPYKAVYSASKSFVMNFSLAIRVELKHTPISVSVVNPNGVRTNIGTNARIDSHGFMGRATEIKPEDLARLAIDKTLAGKAVIIPKTLNKMLAILSKAPNGLKQRILTKEFDKEVQVSKK
jgi:short-subunit dehydrogenase